MRVVDVDAAVATDAPALGVSRALKEMPHCTWVRGPLRNVGRVLRLHREVRPREVIRRDDAQGVALPRGLSELALQPLDAHVLRLDLRRIDAHSSGSHWQISRGLRPTPPALQKPVVTDLNISPPIPRCFLEEDSN